MYAHLGWMLLKQNPKRIGRTDITDLNSDILIRIQHKYYGIVVIVMGFLVPAAIAGLFWDDWRGGFYYAGICRLVIVHHATFCVNSLAHWLGDQPFDDRHSPRDHIFTAFVTLGEGYHNYHHSYPSDYRNAIQWWQYDPTKWLIIACYQLGLASGLKKFSSNEIQKGMLQQQQKKLDQWRAKLDWGIPLDRLPVMEFEEFEEQSKTRPLILVAGVVHDVGAFIKEHPGGVALISSGIGKDMTAAFNGGNIPILFLIEETAINMNRCLRPFKRRTQSPQHNASRHHPRRHGSRGLEIPLDQTATRRNGQRPRRRP